METWLDLMEETKNHFAEGAKSIRAYTNDKTFIITQVKDTNQFWVASEEPGFPKTKTDSLEKYFKDVFGIEARY